MRLKVALPAGVLFEKSVEKVIAEAPGGSFCLLPRHADYVSALAPGILSYVESGSQEAHLAVDEGVLVKQGSDVLVATANAAAGPLGELRDALQRQKQKRDEREEKARAALGKMEASLVRQILQWKERARG